MLMYNLPKCRGVEWGGGDFFLSISLVHFLTFFPDNIPIWIRSIFSSIVLFYVQKIWGLCMAPLLSLSLFSIRLPPLELSLSRWSLVQQCISHTHTHIHTQTHTHIHIHDACLSWFPFCSSFCHVHCCVYWLHVDCSIPIIPTKWIKSVFRSLPGPYPPPPSLKSRHPIHLLTLG